MGDTCDEEIKVGDFFEWAEYKSYNLYRLIKHLPHPYGPCYVAQVMNMFHGDSKLETISFYNLRGYKKTIPTEEELAAWAAMIMKS